ncbi:MAG TPA: NYN domain-containing protein [Actinomycetes bacterium]|nr:NYN domain-containing protein [Actinomycetes bacterium]
MLPDAGRHGEVRTARRIEVRTARLIEVRMARLIVDGMNVIGARAGGWWRDRAAAVRAFAAQLGDLGASGADELTLVLDGPVVEGLPEGDHRGVRVVYARRRGRDAADDRIVELVADAGEPRALVVVTSDRALRERVGALGAQVLGAGALLRRLDGAAGAAPPARPRDGPREGPR